GGTARGTDALRHRVAARDRVLPGRRELFAAPAGPGTGLDNVVPAGLLPGRLAAVRGRIAQHPAAGAGTVLRRPGAEGDTRRVRVPAAERDGQPAADLRGVRPAHQPGDLRLGDAWRLRDEGFEPGG